MKPPQWPPPELSALLDVGIRSDKALRRQQHQDVIIRFIGCCICSDMLAHVTIQIACAVQLMEERMERIAQCVCGSLRAITTGDPALTYVCHCNECQRRTGSVMHAGASFLKAQVRVKGVAKVFTRLGNSGGTLRFHFCPECGSTVVWDADKFPDRIGVAIGCFADRDFPPPTLSVWEEGMHDWVGLPHGLSRYEQAPT